MCYFYLKNSFFLLHLPFTHRKTCQLGSNRWSSCCKAWSTLSLCNHIYTSINIEIHNVYINEQKFDFSWLPIHNSVIIVQRTINQLIWVRTTCLQLLWAPFTTLQLNLQCHGRIWGITVHRGGSEEAENAPTDCTKAVIEKPLYLIVPKKYFIRKSDNGGNNICGKKNQRFQKIISLCVQGTFGIMIILAHFYSEKCIFHIYYIVISFYIVDFSVWIVFFFLARDYSKMAGEKLNSEELYLELFMFCFCLFFYKPQ